MSGYEAVEETPASPSAVPATMTSSQENAEAEKVQRDVRTILTALYAGDLDVVLEYTHPKIIEALGGDAKAKDEVASLLSKLKTSGISLESLTFPSPPTFFQTAADEFVIVPTLTILSAGRQRVESLNFQLGNRKIGASSWTYIEGSRVNQQNAQQLFPDFPDDFEFPKFYRKKL